MRKYNPMFHRQPPIFMSKMFIRYVIVLFCWHWLLSSDHSHHHRVYARPFMSIKINSTDLSQLKIRSRSTESLRLVCGFCSESSAIDHLDIDRTLESRSIIIIRVKRMKKQKRKKKENKKKNNIIQINPNNTSDILLTKREKKGSSYEVLENVNLSYAIISSGNDDDDDDDDDDDNDDNDDDNDDDDDDDHKDDDTNKENIIYTLIVIIGIITICINCIEYILCCMSSG
uniref:Uncharacterized protein n=1 Tax=Penaeus monodon majanivirus B TaxID=2984272 RepID=A0A9C7BLI6_9VIRU|nr:MAG: hypothetical protein [Penaeus monodon majanivirus B]